MSAKGSKAYLVTRLHTAIGQVPTLQRGKAISIRCCQSRAWSELYGKPISQRYLAATLKKYGIKPQKVKVDGRSLQGYRREHCWDAWERYLPSPVSEWVEPPEPPVLSSHTESSPVPKVPEVPEFRISEGVNEREPCPRCAEEGCGYCEPATLREFSLLAPIRLHEADRCPFEALSW